MNKEQKSKPIGWFKGVLSNHNETEAAAQHEEKSLPENSGNANDYVQEQTEDEASNVPLFSRENKDKLTLDLAIAVENVLNDRQLALFKNKGLEEKLHNANETIIRLRNENAKKEQTILEKDREIRGLEEKLTTKQMSYDQLLEDYKDYQNTSNHAFENLKYQLEKEISKYRKLDEEFTNYQYQNLQTIKNLEETIRDLEVDNQQLTEQHDTVLEEKNQLMQTINDFTKRMSFSLSDHSKAAVPPASEE